MTAELLRHSALPAGLLPAGAPATVELRERPGRTVVELRVPTAEDGTADTAPAEAALGRSLPTSGRTGVVDGRLAVWLGPGWWLLDGSPEGTGELECALARTLRGPRSSAVDVSAGFVALELTGPYAAAVLAHGCALDLHPRAFAEGRATRTMLAKGMVVLARCGGASTYRIWVRTSFARYLVEWLLDASVEYR